MKKITALMIAAVLAIFGLSLAPTNNTYAEDVCDHLTRGSDVWKANGCDGSASTNLSDVIITIINSIVGALGLVAVIVIVIGGVNYMTSAGDAGKLEKAKKTILYAAIGLVICALSFAIVNFVIVNILRNDTESSEESSEETPSIRGGGPVS